MFVCSFVVGFCVLISYGLYNKHSIFFWNSGVWRGDWVEIGHGLDMVWDWIRIGFGFGLDWIRIGHGLRLDSDWIRIGFGLDSDSDMGAHCYGKSRDKDDDP